MRRLVLSRKGFDSSSGKSASPIFNDGRIFSLPIPEPHPPSPKKYYELQFNGISGVDALKECPSKSVLADDYCHYDPALNKNEGIFGQHHNAQRELINNGVDVGDLFLFFGFYRNFSLNRKKELHHLFGWLQIDKIITGDGAIRDYLEINNIQHPHGYGDLNTYEKNNTIYIGKRNLTIKNTQIPNKGYGLFKKTHTDLILTREGETKARWQLPIKYFSKSKKDIFLNRLNKKGWLNEEKYFVNNFGRGQEYILDAEKYPRIIDWAHYLISNHG